MATKTPVKEPFKLKGKRTYITAASGILLIAGNFLATGTFDLTSIRSVVQEALPYFVGIFLRAGIPSK